MSFDRWGSVDTAGTTTSGTIWAVYRSDAFATATEPATISFPVLEPDAHALPRDAQLEVIARLSAEGRRRVSAHERSRFGWHDAPRRPCFRGVRVR